MTQFGLSRKDTAKDWHAYTQNQQAATSASSKMLTKSSTSCWVVSISAEQTLADMPQSKSQMAHHQVSQASNRQSDVAAEAQ